MTTPPHDPPPPPTPPGTDTGAARTTRIGTGTGTGLATIEAAPQLEPPQRIFARHLPVTTRADRLLPPEPGPRVRAAPAQTRIAAPISGHTVGTHAYDASKGALNGPTPAAIREIAPSASPPVSSTRARRRSAGRASRFWTWWSHQVIRNRVAAAVLGLAILGTLAGVATTINISQPRTSSLAGSGAHTDGLNALEHDGFPSGTLTAVPVWLPQAAQAPSTVKSLGKPSSLRGAVTSAAPVWRQGGSAIVIAIPRNEVGTSHGGSSLADIKRTVPKGALVGGQGALAVDEVNSTYGAFPLLFVIVAVVTFLLLARGLRSILLPAKAVVLNALSVAASYGILVLVFQHGLGTQTLWGTKSYGSIDSVTPVLIFGFLFGVSMDYEVFILSRVREVYDRTGDTQAGIVEGVSRTGRLVTSAALILFFALASLSTANNITVREIAAGLAAGVILDAIVVRMLLLPALVSLFGKANWWMPGWAGRLLRIPRTGPAESPERPPGGAA